MGESLLLMDMNFVLLAEIPLYQSLIIKREYYGVGSFKLTLKRGAPGGGMLARDRLLYLHNRTDTMLLIEKVTRSDDTITADGLMLKGLAARRICVPPTAATSDPYRGFGWDRFTGDAESAILHFAAGNLTSPEDQKRKMARMTLAQNQHRGDSLPWQARFDKLSDVLATIGQTTGIGWDVRPDFANKQFVFGAWEGMDSTTGAGRAVFSREVGSVSSATYMDDGSAQVSTVYAGGAGEDENRMIYSIGNECTGWDRRELFTAVSGVETVEMLTLGAQQKLSSPRLTLTAQVRDCSLCRYRIDYDVGDVVTVVDDGAQMNARLIAMQETHEKGAVTLAATFGDAPVTLVSRLKQERSFVNV
ncbi:MAG: siphovirus ReqiPepy6 Gp37-like family protein [Clostridia bacterium]|nr:siphovirus ReqiPepy6 Gp37-like family protein [Clostridia bacterium]